MPSVAFFRVSETEEITATLFRSSGIELMLTDARLFKVSEMVVVTSALFRRSEIVPTLSAVLAKRLDTEEITAALFRMSVIKARAASVTMLTSGESTKAPAGEVPGHFFSDGRLSSSVWLDNEIPSRIIDFS